MRFTGFGSVRKTLTWHPHHSAPHPLSPLQWNNFRNEKLERERCRKKRSPPAATTSPLLSYSAAVQPHPAVLPWSPLLLQGKGRGPKLHVRGRRVDAVRRAASLELAVELLRSVVLSIEPELASPSFIRVLPPPLQGSVIAADVAERRRATTTRSCVPRRCRHRSTATTARVPPPSFQCCRSCPLFPSSFCLASPALKSASTTVKLCWSWCCFWRFGVEPCPVLSLLMVLAAAGASAAIKAAWIRNIGFTAFKFFNYD
ncbi:uncharacterized protein LOC110265072 [Arachis ipaensis]|uniref:uncharacterized protein LOC110265072 n=1 Tax=Arachis ipaensis TaxID=130454 RepID=UPI000A2B84CC|nr:uncharacterized protein LOC110265072 [Arachis ipaensis]XP_025664819.1 uncharacterized protein LOC112763337 [Arachis hypogaea]